MALAVFDTVTQTGSFKNLPLRLDQGCSWMAAVSRLVLVGPALLVLAVPLALLATQMLVVPGTLDRIAERPLAAVQVVVGLALWGALLLIPIRSALLRLWSSRQVEIAADRVTVHETALFDQCNWSLPVSSYLGVAHHIRASLSGLSHEIVLVHADPRRSVTVLVADRVTQSMVDEVKHALALPEVPAKALYESKTARVHRRAPIPAFSPARA